MQLETRLVAAAQHGGLPPGAFHGKIIQPREAPHIGCGCRSRDPWDKNAIAGARALDDAVMTIDVASWLRDLELAEYAAAFAEHAVDADVLPLLTADDLRDIGVVKVGDRRRMLAAIEALKAIPGPDAREAPESQAEPVPDEAPKPSLESAERRQLSILVCDIEGSTELTTELGPEEMRDLIARFQRHCAAAIRQFGGYVGPFLGDGMIAYFGFPRTLENDAESALRAGLAIIHRLSHATDLARPLGVRIGVASGTVVVGRLDDPGSQAEQTVIGDTPALAARLQTLAAPGTMVCGSITRQLAGDLFRFKPMGRVPVKGFASPVIVFEVLSESDVETRFAATRVATIARMVGRTLERDLILERWSMAERGEGQAVVITGIPGIGKSRLVRSIVDHIEAAGHRRVSLQCSPLFAESPLYPVVRQLEAAAGVSHGDAPEVRMARLKRYLVAARISEGIGDELAPLLMNAVGGVPEATPDRLREGTFRALVNLFLDMAESGPSLIVLEDIHWIDPSTRELVQRMLVKACDKAILVVLTVRPEADTRWLQPFDPLVVQLMKLSRTQSAEFLQEIFGDRVISMPIARRIIDRTDGIPLFLEEVCQSLIERDSLQPDANGRIDMEQALAFVPATLYDTLLSRLDHNPQAKSVAQVAACIGREFRLELLRAVYPGTAAELDAGLAALVAADLVHPVSDGAFGLYTFKHGLTHQAAYETLLLRHRQELHARIADRVAVILPAFVRNRPEIVARHLTAAASFVPAAATWLAAGQQALSRGAYEEAVQHLRAGLAAVAQLPAGAEHDGHELPLQITLAQALRAARFTSGDEALNACRRARHLSEVLCRSEELLRVLRLEFGILFNRPDIAAAEAVARAFLEAGALAGNPAAAALGHQAMGKVLFFKGAFEAAYASMVLSLEPAALLRSADLLSHYQYPVAAMVYQAFAAYCLGRPREARRITEEALAISRQSAEFTHSLTLANILILERMQHGTDRTAALLDELRRIALARGAPFWVDLVGYHEGMALVVEGELDAGVAGMRQALATFAANSVEVEIPFYQAMLAEVLIAADRLAEADDLLADAVARVERTQERWPLAEILRLRFATAVRCGDVETAARRLAEARTVCAEQGATLWAERLEATVRGLGAPGAARRGSAGRVALVPGAAD
jgi:class 3 adenylate cyclase/tetratricopeptide (TPR) repeat protein